MKTSRLCLRTVANRFRKRLRCDGLIPHRSRINRLAKLLLEISIDRFRSFGPLTDLSRVCLKLVRLRMVYLKMACTVLDCFSLHKRGASPPRRGRGGEAAWPWFGQDSPRCWQVLGKALPRQGDWKVTCKGRGSGAAWPRSGQVAAGHWRDLRRQGDQEMCL